MVVLRVCIGLRSKKSRKQRTESGEAEKDSLKKWGKADTSKAAEKQRNRENRKAGKQKSQTKTEIEKITTQKIQRLNGSVNLKKPSANPT